jgi:hypothetical protein
MGIDGSLMATCRITVMNLIMEYILGNAAVLRGFSPYLARLIGLDSTALVVQWQPVDGWTFQLDFVAVALVVLMTTMIMFGTRESASFNNGEAHLSSSGHGPMMDLFLNSVPAGFASIRAAVCEHTSCLHVQAFVNLPVVVLVEGPARYHCATSSNCLLMHCLFLWHGMHQPKCISLRMKATTHTGRVNLLTAIAHRGYTRQSRLAFKCGSLVCGEQNCHQCVADSLCVCGVCSHDNAAHEPHRVHHDSGILKG